MRVLEMAISTGEVVNNWDFSLVGVVGFGLRPDLGSLWTDLISLIPLLFGQLQSPSRVNSHGWRSSRYGEGGGDLKESWKLEIFGRI